MAKDNADAQRRIMEQYAELLKLPPEERLQVAEGFEGLAKALRDSVE